MRSALKKMAGGLVAAVLALVVAAGACQAAVIINLSLDVNTGAKEWSVYATLTDPSNETLGLAGLGFDAWGSQTEYGDWSGPLAVDSFTRTLPAGLYFKPPTGPMLSLGFTELHSGAAVGTGYELIGAAQSSTHTIIVDGVTYDNILQGVGESAGSAPSSYGDIVWADPVLVAEGTYTGTEGWVNVSLRKDTMGLATSAWVLPDAIPVSGSSYVAFYPDAGDDYRASVYVPEPATLALLGLGGLGLLLRRKRR